MSVVKLRNIARLNIQAALFGCFELVLVDIPILVTNSGRMGAKGWNLAKADHLWPQIVQRLLKSRLKKLSRICSKETALVERHHV